MKMVDERTGNWMRKLINRIDRRVWGGWDSVHNMGFDKAEEDELLFAQMLLSPGILIPFPYFHQINDNKFLDNEPQDVRQNAMNFYESSIKRFLYAANGHRTYLAKNVMSTGRFKSLMKQFPDAKIIYIARHPYQAIPSFASMCTSMYKYYLPDIPDDAPTKKAWGQLGIDFYKYSKEMRKSIPSSQFIQLKYDDLIRDPKSEVLKVYQHFGWQPSNELLDKLNHEKRANGNYQSGHEYTLEQFGFSKQEIYTELGDIMDEFGFEKGF